MVINELLFLFLSEGKTFYEAIYCCTAVFDVCSSRGEILWENSINLVENLM